MDVIDRVSAVLLAAMVAGALTYWLGVWVPQRDAYLSAITDCMAEKMDEYPDAPQEYIYENCRIAVEEIVR